MFLFQSFAKLKNLATQIIIVVVFLNALVLHVTMIMDCILCSPNWIWFRNKDITSIEIGMGIR